MTNLVYTLIAIPYLTTGRRMYALKLCLTVANALGIIGLSEILEDAIAHENETIAMERAWARSKNSSAARGKAMSIDRQIGGLLGIIHSSLENNLTGLDTSSAAAPGTKRLQEQLFPEGVQPIITLPFEEQLAVNDVVISRLKGDLASDADDASVDRFVTRLDALNEAFRAELHKSKIKEVSFDDLTAARDKGNLNIRYFVAAVLADYPHDSDDAENGAALLQPILEQSTRTRQARKGRRLARDVDPETGEELGDGVLTAEAPAVNRETA